MKPLVLILQRDMQQLMSDSENVQKGLEMVEHDHAGRARKPQQSDLMQIIEHLKRLDFDLSTMLTDCLCLGRRQYGKDHNIAVIDTLHQSFGTRIPCSTISRSSEWPLVKHIPILLTFSNWSLIGADSKKRSIKSRSPCNNLSKGGRTIHGSPQLRKE